VGRAEDQAYLMSVLGDDAVAIGPRLAYVHAAGLLMRHDKEAFAGEAIAAAQIGRLVGDDVRILLFSAYADGPGGRRGAASARGKPFHDLSPSVSGSASRTRLG
jgi:hypothetical protein